MFRRAYPTDLTDKQWQLIEALIPLPRAGGRPRTVDMREIINAIFFSRKAVTRIHTQNQTIKAGFCILSLPRR